MVWLLFQPKTKIFGFLTLSVFAHQTMASTQQTNTALRLVELLPSWAVMGHMREKFFNTVERVGPALTSMTVEMLSDFSPAGVALLKGKLSSFVQDRGFLPSIDASGRIGTEPA